MTFLVRYNFPNSPLPLEKYLFPWGHLGESIGKEKKRKSPPCSRRKGTKEL